MPPPSPKATNPFTIASAVATVPASPLPMTLHPTEGHVVVDAQGRRYPLLKLLGQGGEGSVFQSENNLVCKIYRPERATAFAKAKLDLMTSRTLDYPGLCWPRAVLYNERREFVGYAMNRAAGREIQKTIFIKPIFATTFPRWDKSNLVNLSISILRVIDFLHAHNVLVGDLNPRNILIEDDRRVYFVDTDSFQVEGFPSPVGMPPFLAPSLFSADLSKTLRDIDQENFAIATLMFMLMVPGKPPYSHCGGETPASSVLKGHFPYALGEKHGKDAPEGPWVFIWSNLPFYIKEAFTAVFAEGKSLSVTDWGELMTRYRSDLQKLDKEGTPWVSRDLFPTTYKTLSRKVVEEKGGLWITCSYHGGEFGWFPKGKQLQPPGKPMCRDCAMKKVAVTCSNCGITRLAIPLPDYVKTYEKGLPIICEDCSNGRMPVAPACSSCGTRAALLASGICPACDARVQAASARHVSRPTMAASPPPARPPARPAPAPPPPTVVRQPRTWVEEVADWVSGLFR